MTAATQRSPLPDRDRNRPVEVFTPELIERLRLGTEPPTALEAELSGPWHPRRLPDGGFGLYRDGDREYGTGPVVRMADRLLALLAAAALVGTARPATYRIEPEAGATGYPIRRGQEEVGSADYFMADLCTALDVLDAVVSSPSALACLLEAAGPTALERAGRELGLRISNQDPEAPER